MGPNFTDDADRELFIKASPRDKVAIAIQFAEHEAAQKECHDFGQRIAEACGCTLIKGPMKTLVRADKKVGEDYKGDWSQVKDLVRMTILAKTPSEVDSVGTAIRAATKMPWCVLKDTEAKAETDSCGYSGLNFVLQKNRKGSIGAKKLGQAEARPGPDAQGISNAQWAKTVRMEIQVNVPEIIYGKEAAEDFVKMLGEHGAGLLEKMKGRYRIVGGLGHVFYEISKGAVTPDVQNKAKALSQRYYAYLRRPNVSNAEFVKLCTELAAFVEQTKLFFHKHPVQSVSLIGKLTIPAAFRK